MANSPSWHSTDEHTHATRQPMPSATSLAHAAMQPSHSAHDEDNSNHLRSRRHLLMMMCSSHECPLAHHASLPRDNTRRGHKNNNNHAFRSNRARKISNRHCHGSLSILFLNLPNSTARMNQPAIGPDIQYYSCKLIQIPLQLLLPN